MADRPRLVIATGNTGKLREYRELLAGTGFGAWKSVEAACAATVRVAEAIEPQHADVMAAAYKEYRRIYPALKMIQGG